MEPEPLSHVPPSLTAEHDWGAASGIIHPALRPAGTAGVSGQDVKVPAHGSPGQPLTMPGPADLQTVFVIPASGFHILVSAEHMLSWNVTPDEIRQAAMTNLANWSAQAAWSEDVDGGRHVVWSDWGEGMDAARILLPEIRNELVGELAQYGRVLVGIPEQSLVIATCLAPGDEEFASMFANYLADRWSESSDPIDSRVFELVGDELVEFAPVAAGA